MIALPLAATGLKLGLLDPHRTQEARQNHSRLKSRGDRIREASIRNRLEDMAMRMEIHITILTRAIIITPALRRRLDSNIGNTAGKESGKRGRVGMGAVEDGNMRRNNGLWRDEEGVLVSRDAWNIPSLYNCMKRRFILAGCPPNFGARSFERLEAIINWEMEMRMHSDGCTFLVPFFSPFFEVGRVVYFSLLFFNEDEVEEMCSWGFC